MSTSSRLARKAPGGSPSSLGVYNGSSVRSFSFRCSVNGVFGVFGHPMGRTGRGDSMVWYWGATVRGLYSLVFVLGGFGGL